MTLLHLLLGGIVVIFLRSLLVLALLLLLQFLMVLILFRSQLVLLLLILLVQRGVACARRRALVRLDVAGVRRGIGACRASTRGIIFRACWRSIGSASFAGRNPGLEIGGPGGGGDGRLALVGGGTQLRVRACCLQVLRLRRYGTDVAASSGRFFLWTGARFHSAIAAAVTDAARARIIVYDGGVVGVVDDRDVYVVHAPVVEKVSVIPAAAFVAVAEIPEAVVDPAIKTNRRAPETFMKNVYAVAPSPVAGRPQEANLRRFHPRSGDPIIVVVAPRPIPGRPDVVVARADGLLVNWQSGRSKGNGNADC